jgi:hypothetical protein
VLVFAVGIGIGRGGDECWDWDSDSESSETASFSNEPNVSSSAPRPLHVMHITSILSTLGINVLKINRSENTIALCIYSDFD